MCFEIKIICEFTWTSLIPVIIFFHPNTYHRNQCPCQRIFFCPLLCQSSVSSEYNLLLLLCFSFIVENEGRLQTGAVCSLWFFWERGKNGVFAHLIELICDADTTRSQCTLFILRLKEGKMLRHVYMYDFSGLQLKSVHWKSSSSMERDGFTFINCKYLYRARSRTSVSELLHKAVSLKSRPDALLSHQGGRPGVPTKTRLAVQSVTWAQFTGRLWKLTEGTVSCVSACLESCATASVRSSIPTTVMALAGCDFSLPFLFLLSLVYSFILVVFLHPLLLSFLCCNPHPPLVFLQNWITVISFIPAILGRLRVDRRVGEKKQQEDCAHKN